jgi:hypothetical protein
MAFADDIWQQAMAHQDLFIAGIRATDESGPSARKLAALIEQCEQVLNHLNEYGCAPAFGSTPFAYHAAALLNASIKEAQK